MLGKNSISGENEVNLPTIKRIVSRFLSRPDTMRFSDFKDFLPSLVFVYPRPPGAGPPGPPFGPPPPGIELTISICFSPLM